MNLRLRAWPIAAFVAPSCLLGLVSAGALAVAPVENDPAISLRVAGDNTFGQLDLPAPPSGVTYVSVDAGSIVSVALRSDGQAVYASTSSFTPNPVPPLPDGITYVGVSLTGSEVALLRSDGEACAQGYCNDGDHVPIPPSGIHYVDVAANQGGTMLIRSDGAAIWKQSQSSLEKVLVPPNGKHYVAVASGYSHFVLLRSDGKVRFFDNERFEGVDDLVPFGTSYLHAPRLTRGERYVAVAAGQRVSVFLTSEGQVLVTGRNNAGQRRVPPLPKGLEYTAISFEAAAGALLRSDGEVVTIGRDGDKKVLAPRLAPGFRYLLASAGWKSFIGGAAPIPTGVKVPSSFKKLPGQRSVRKGAKVRLKGVVQTRAPLDDTDQLAVVRVRWRGATLDRARVHADDGHFTAKFGTQRFAAGHTYTIKLRFLGASRAQKSAVESVRLIIKR